VAIQLAKSIRVQSVIAIAPDGLGTPVERIQGFLAMVAGRGLAIALAPVDDWFPAGRTLFLAGTRSLPWQIAPADAKQILADFANSPAYDATNWASLFDMPTHLHTITQPTLFLQGTADPLMTPQISRYVSLVPRAKLTYLPGLNHVPISDHPKAVARHMLTFLRDVARQVLPPSKHLRVPEHQTRDVETNEQRQRALPNILVPVLTAVAVLEIGMLIGLFTGGCCKHQVDAGTVIKRER
jgi:hypothetical protein